MIEPYSIFAPPIFLDSEETLILISYPLVFEIKYSSKNSISTSSFGSGIVRVVNSYLLDSIVLPFKSVELI